MPQPTAYRAPADHRRRLLDAMIECVADRGYAATTIAELAARAHVSKRTFYEHFAGKAECLAALYALASARSLSVLRDAIDPAGRWQDQVEQALAAYFGTLGRSPALLRTLFIEILGLGAPGLAARRAAAWAFADFIVATVQHDAATPGTLPREMALSIVGGINELILDAIETGRSERLHELVAPAARLVRAVITGTAAAATPLAPR